MWESTVAEMTVRQIAYHTLFFVEIYLSPSEAAFPAVAPLDCDGLAIMNA